MRDPGHPDDRLATANRIVLSLTLICLALAGVTAYLLLRPVPPVSEAALLGDPELREQVSARLAATSRGIYDSHVDGDVGRILQPRLRERDWRGVKVSSNRLGLRESEIAFPKPPNTVRVVLLGDSYVFGYGVAAEDRLGVFLEAWLQQRSPGFEGTVECLHVGIPSWNFRAQIAYLTRQLSLLDPDLVIHVSLPNDIEDAAATRGFGVPARFSSQLRARADSLIDAGFPHRVLGLSRSGYLRWGIDGEGAGRYREAVTSLERLARDVAASGGRYRLVLHYKHYLATSLRHLGRYLDPRQVVYTASSFAMAKRYWISENDAHWNREGHLAMARMLYGLIVRDGLLPRLAPDPWPEAAAALEEIADAGRREAEGEAGLPRLRIGSELLLAELGPREASQIHGGVDPQGLVSPYASMVLSNDGGRRLRVSGRALPRPELDGAQVRVSVDAWALAELELRAGEPIEVDVPLPAAAAERPYLSVRFESTDYVYTGATLQHCVVFELLRVAIER
ncbi:MAG: SGNH/GDSL hydrolase family protein [Acidobacteriota bacterium]